MALIALIALIVSIVWAIIVKDYPIGFLALGVLLIFLSTHPSINT